MEHLPQTRPKSCLPTKVVGNLTYQSMKQTKLNDLKNLKEANDHIKEDQLELIEGGAPHLQGREENDPFDAQDSEDVFLVPEKSLKDKLRLKFKEGKKDHELVLHRFTHLMPKNIQ